MAEIKANGQNLGVITSSFYTNSGSIRQHATKRYLDRNIRITPAVQPSSPVAIRLYLTTAEFNALDLDPLSGISSISDLKILKNNDACVSTISSSTTMITPVWAELHGTSGYVLQADISSFSSFYFGSADVILPTELVHFKGSLQNNSTLLKWETLNESNTAHFQVERSINGNNFETIGTVGAIGNNPGTTGYSYTDNNVTSLGSPLIYYRLKIVDFDGAYKRSSIVTIALPDITGRLSVFPNPTRHEVKIIVNAAAGGKAQWKLIDNSGLVVLQNTTQLKKGANSFVINLNTIPAGVYYFTLYGAGVDQHVKIQKL
jgi:hypothetical protein